MTEKAVTLSSIYFTSDIARVLKFASTSKLLCIIYNKSCFFHLINSLLEAVSSLVLHVDVYVEEYVAIFSIIKGVADTYISFSCKYSCIVYTRAMSISH